MIIEQDNRQLKPIVKQLLNETDSNLSAYYFYFYEISFLPELDTACRIEIECIDNSDKIVYGDTFRVDVKSMDFIVIPFPLTPFALGKKASFNSKSNLFLIYKEN